MRRIRFESSTFLFLSISTIELLFAPFAHSMQTQPAAQTKKSHSRSIFIEAEDRAGIDFQHYNGANGKFHLPEIMGSGAALFD
jgi:hypothetical protein